MPILQEIIRTTAYAFQFSTLKRRVNSHSTRSKPDSINLIEYKIRIAFAFKPNVDLAGEVAHIFKSEYNSKPVYVISLDKEFIDELKLHNQNLNMTLTQDLKH